MKKSKPTNVNDAVRPPGDDPTTHALSDTATHALSDTTTDALSDTATDASSETATEAFERLAEEVAGDGRSYVLRLYVTGMTPRSTEAFKSITRICEEHLHGRYELEVIDIYQHPHLAVEDQIVAAPTLVKALPEPLRRLIGDLSDTERVLAGLDLRRKT